MGLFTSASQFSLFSDHWVEGSLSTARAYKDEIQLQSKAEGLNLILGSN